MLVVGLAAYFKFFENRVIFYPESTIAVVPRIPFDDVTFTADDGTKLNGWFMPFPGAERVFVISHGNAGNIGDRSELGQYVRQELRSAVFLYDFAVMAAAKASRRRRACIPTFEELYVT